MIKVGSDFSGVGAFDQALIRLGIKYETVFACDMDKYARQTYILNYGEPKYYPKNVYDREIPKKSLDIYMTSPPCQAFSLAGKRKGENDERGILFYNSHEFIKKNKPRFFIFENVKGLLSDNNGNTFQNWIYLLGGKSVNGNVVIFSHDDSVPYHIYYQVMNAKHYGVPQNRERIFIIGIRDDEDNNFSFPKPLPLTKRLKDVLEPEVDEKYFLSEKMLDNLTSRKDNFNNGKINYKDENSVASTLTKSSSSIDISDNILKIGTWRTHDDGKGFREIDDNNCPTIPARAREDGSGQPVIKMNYAYGRKALNETLENENLPNELSIIDSYNKKIKSDVSPSILTTIDSANNHHVFVPTNNSKGFDIAEEDSINFSVPSSTTRRGRVGKKVSQTLDTQCNQGIATRKPTKQEIEEYEGIAVHPNSKKMEFDGFKDGNCPTILATDYKAPKCIVFNTQRIRRLTPKEAFRLMDFNENFKWDVSDSQAYKQAGNSIVVNCLVEIIKKLNL